MTELDHSEGLLVVVARNPEIGAVKTRLIPAAGVEGARALYRAFLRDLSARFAGAAHGLAWAYTPEGGPLPPDLVGGAGFPQEGADLSHRLLNIFRRSWEQGTARTVVISSDVPHLPERVVREAFAALAACDVVLAPSEDGGYHLVGMSRPHDIFTMVPMSTPSVLTETRAAIERLRLRLRLLEGDFDVDLPEDLPRLRARLARDGLHDSHTARQLGRLDPSPGGNTARK